MTAMANYGGIIQVYGKFCNFTVDRDHNYKKFKVRKQGWSPTPADILVEI